MGTEFKDTCCVENMHKLTRLGQHNILYARRVHMHLCVCVCVCVCVEYVGSTLPHVRTRHRDLRVKIISTM